MTPAKLLCAAMAALLLPSLAYAQTTATPTAPAPATPAAPATTTSAQPAVPPLNAATAKAVDQRIATLKSRLEITAAELPLWDNFAQIMRDNAARTQALFAQRADNAAKMTATENMDSYAAIAREYADNTQRLATAFDSLYGSLSDTQKKTADTLFREQASTARQPVRR